MDNKKSTDDSDAGSEAGQGTSSFSRAISLGKSVKNSPLDLNSSSHDDTALSKDVGFKRPLAGVSIKQKTVWRSRHNGQDPGYTDGKESTTYACKKSGTSKSKYLEKSVSGSPELMVNGTETSYTSPEGFRIAGIPEDGNQELRENGFASSPRSSVITYPNPDVPRENHISETAQKELHLEVFSDVNPSLNCSSARTSAVSRSAETKKLRQIRPSVGNKIVEQRQEEEPESSVLGRGRRQTLLNTAELRKTDSQAAASLLRLRELPILRRDSVESLAKSDSLASTECDIMQRDSEGIASSPVTEGLSQPPTNVWVNNKTHSPRISPLDAARSVTFPPFLPHFDNNKYPPLQVQPHTYPLQFEEPYPHLQTQGSNLNHRTPIPSLYSQMECPLFYPQIQSPLGHPGTQNFLSHFQSQTPAVQPNILNRFVHRQEQGSLRCSEPRTPSVSRQGDTVNYGLLDPFQQQKLLDFFQQQKLLDILQQQNPLDLSQHQNPLVVNILRQSPLVTIQPQIPLEIPPPRIRIVHPQIPSTRESIRSQYSPKSSQPHTLLVDNILPQSPIETSSPSNDPCTSKLYQLQYPQSYSHVKYTSNPPKVQYNSNPFKAKCTSSPSKAHYTELYEQQYPENSSHAQGNSKLYQLEYPQGSCPPRNLLHPLHSNIVSSSPSKNTLNTSEPQTPVHDQSQSPVDTQPQNGLNSSEPLGDHESRIPVDYDVLQNHLIISQPSTHVHQSISNACDYTQTQDLAMPYQRRNNVADSQPLRTQAVCLLRTSLEECVRESLLNVATADEQQLLQ